VANDQDDAVARAMQANAARTRLSIGLEANAAEVVAH